MGSVRVAIVGVGNCASSLVQGVHYYKDADPASRVPGLMHVQFGPYHVRDVEFVDEPGVTNETVQSFCPLDPVGHIGLAYDPDVADLVQNALDPADAVAVTCSVGAPG